MKLLGPIPKYVYLCTVAIIPALLFPERVSDVSHELSIVSRAWFVEHAIPLVQSFSHYGPMGLYLSHLWSLFFTDGFASRIATLVLATVTVLLGWFILSSGKKRSNDTIACGLMFAAACYGSGVFARGPNTTSIGMFLATATIALYIKWLRSGPSYWLFGNTDKNWRYLLLSAVTLSALLYTEYLYAIPLILVGAMFLYKTARSAGQFARYASFYALPIVLHSWLWVSFFASRQLLGAWIDTQLLHLDIVADRLPPLALLCIIPLVGAMGAAFITVRGSHYSKDRLRWLVALIMIVVGAIGVASPGVVVVLSPLFVLAGAFVTRAQHTMITRLQAVYRTAGLASVALCLLYTLGGARALRIDNYQVELARSYIADSGPTLPGTTGVLYIGQGSGFYTYELLPSTSFVDAEVFRYDTDRLQLIDRLRGENEATSPQYAVVATGSLKIDAPNRVTEYLDKHYQKTASLDGFDIYTRR